MSFNYQKKQLKRSFFLNSFLVHSFISTDKLRSQQHGKFKPIVIKHSI